MNSCKIFKHLRLIHNNHRFYSNVNSGKIIEPSANLLVPLKSRKLLKVYGKDAPNFLQGLITNDMRHFEDHAKSMYAMFLNNKGRVMYDSLIYKWENDQSFLVECDETVIPTLKKYFKLFKLKQAVNVEDMVETLFIWALITPPNKHPSEKINTSSPINVFKDPRLTELGCRILTSPSVTADEILNNVAKGSEVKVGDEDNYKYLRYKLGVGEGPEELPSGSCFPLEANCDYLHGVSFHKGCYIGQELTARVYHTGVIRKRLMPIKFDTEVKELEKDTAIRNAEDPKSNLGKLKGYMQNYGLGLVRIKETLEAKSLMIGENSAKVVKPSWWPLEAPKEKVTSAKAE
ncbi:aminomethyltransferase folate-binding domain-containing protein [Phthorimaea operculella]|nr:aminomethyltransferase folate-binding domain-containing protein [Phthorimaea operculella]